jgi:hypothetical protein
VVLTVGEGFDFAFTLANKILLFPASNSEQVDFGFAHSRSIWRILVIDRCFASPPSVRLTAHIADLGCCNGNDLLVS